MLPSPLIREREGRSDHLININHYSSFSVYYHYDHQREHPVQEWWTQVVPGLIPIHSNTRTCKYNNGTRKEWMGSHFNTDKTRELWENEWLLLPFYTTLKNNRLNRTRNIIHLIHFWYPEWWIKRQQMLRRFDSTVLSNVVFKRISILIIINSSIILEQISSFVFLNV